MPTDRTLITVHNKTTADIRLFHEAWIAAADGVPLPAELADLFTVEIRRNGANVRVVVDFV